MSVSANYSTSTKKVNKVTHKCQKCQKVQPTSRIAGDFCTNCFLLTSHNRFVSTMGRAGIRKFERIIVPFDGDVSTTVLLDHLKYHHCFALPFSNQPHDETNFTTSSLLHPQVNADSYVATAIDISTRPKPPKKPKQQNQPPTIEPSSTEQQPQQQEQPEPEPEPIIPTTVYDSTPFLYQQITTKLNDLQLSQDILSQDSFPFNINNNDYLQLIPTISSLSETYQFATTKLCDSSKFCPYNQPHLNYRCLFVHIEGTFLNTLIASNGLTPFQSLLSQHTTPLLQPILRRMKDTGCKFIHNEQLPYQYPITRLVDIVDNLTTNSSSIPSSPSTSSSSSSSSSQQRILPYMFINSTSNPDQIESIGSQLLTNITTLPVLSIPIEHTVPSSLITQIDIDNATIALQKYQEQQPQLQINQQYYITLLSKTYTLYRLLTSSALPNPTTWQKTHHGYYSSIIDFISILKQQIYTQMAIFTQSRAVLSIPSVEDLSTSIITGLTKGAANSWLPRLIQWSRPLLQKSTSSSLIHGSYVDTNAIQDFSYTAKKTLLHNDPSLPLSVQIPFINIFSDSTTKAIYFHHYYASRYHNLTTHTTLPQLFWFPSEYHLNSTTLISSTKNIDRVSSGFVRLLASMNDSSASNIIKTTDKLTPHLSLQSLHVKYTTTPSQQLASYKQNQAKYQSKKVIVSTKDRTTPPDNVAQFFITDDDDNDNNNTNNNDDNTKSNPTTDTTTQTTTESPPPPQQQASKSKSTKSTTQQQSQQQRPAAPILHYNNTSDGWYGERCCFCGAIAPDTANVPQPPIRTTNGQTEHLQNVPGFCSPCTLIIQDCDPNCQWIKSFVQ